MTLPPFLLAIAGYALTFELVLQIDQLIKYRRRS